MTRFNISLREAVDLVIYALKASKGGEIFVPKLSSYKLIDLAKAIAPKASLSFTGARPGEKIHEEMISFTESANTIEFKNHYIILPSYRDYTIQSYINKNGGKKITKNFTYSSDKNGNFLKINEIKKIISSLLTEI